MECPECQTPYKILQQLDIEKAKKAKKETNRINKFI